MITCLPIPVIRILRIAYLLIGAIQVLAVDPVVSNVQGKQREGSRLVDINYDVADPDSPTLTVYLKVSPDGGKTWKGPVELVSGDVGQHIVPGTAKKLVWDAGKEMANQFGVKFRYRIGASDQWIPPQGLSLIPAGSFMMGGNQKTFAPTFAIDKWEITADLFFSTQTWATNSGYDLKWNSNSSGKYPATGVNWYEAVKWCNARSEKEGRIPAYYEDEEMIVVYRQGEIVPKGIKFDSGYRLPTEVEWEKAARGGVDGKLYPWGTDSITPELANFFESAINHPIAVGSYPPNAYGLYDMAGNAWEWCWDRFDQTSTGRAHRGGGCINWAYNCTVTTRYCDFNLPSYRSNMGGFRCVLPASAP